MGTTPDLGLPELSQSQANPDITHNEALVLLQALHVGVKDKDLSAPPGSPTEGDSYLLAVTTPTGAWTGWKDHIAIYWGGSWRFVPGRNDAGTIIPMGARQEGLTIWVKDENTNYVWSGSPQAWTLPASAAPPASAATEALARFIATPANPGWDPLFVGAAAQTTLSNSNKRSTPASGGPYNGMMGTPARHKGKRYFEAEFASSSFCSIGVCGAGGHQKRSEGNPFGSAQAGQIGWEPGGTVKSRDTTAAVTITTIQTFTGGNRLSVAFDLDNLLIWFRTTSGNWNNSATANPATGVQGIDASWALSNAELNVFWPGGSAGATACDLFLLAADHTQTMPSGFTAWGAA